MADRRHGRHLVSTILTHQQQLSRTKLWTQETSIGSELGALVTSHAGSTGPLPTSRPSFTALRQNTNPLSVSKETPARTCNQKLISANHATHIANSGKVSNGFTTRKGETVELERRRARVTIFRAAVSFTCCERRGIKGQQRPAWISEWKLRNPRESPKPAYAFTQAAIKLSVIRSRRAAHSLVKCPPSCPSPV